MKEAVIFSTTTCTSCDKAIKLAYQFQFGDCGLKEVIVKKLGVDFDMEDMITLLKTTTLPQILIDGTHIGGYSEFEACFTRPKNST